MSRRETYGVFDCLVNEPLSGLFVKFVTPVTGTLVSPVAEAIDDKVTIMSRC